MKILLGPIIGMFFIYIRTGQECRIKIPKTQGMSSERLGSIFNAIEKAINEGKIGSAVGFVALPIL